MNLQGKKSSAAPAQCIEHNVLNFLKFTINSGTRVDSIVKVHKFF